MFIASYLMHCVEANVVYSACEDVKASTRPVAIHFENQRLHFAGSGVSDFCLILSNVVGEEAIPNKILFDSGSREGATK